MKIVINDLSATLSPQESKILLLSLTNQLVGDKERDMATDLYRRLQLLQEGTITGFEK